MKTKLLKQLRKEANKQYRIKEYNKVWYTLEALEPYYIDCQTFYEWREKGIYNKKEYVLQHKEILEREYILKEVRNLRREHSKIVG